MPDGLLHKIRKFKVCFIRMNPFYSIVSLLIAILLIIRQIQVWRYRVLMSPGFYFGFFWAIGFFGVTILHYGDLIDEIYPQYIDELNILAGFTCLCFLFWTKLGRGKINENKIILHFPKRAYKFFCIIILLAALSEVIRTNVTISSIGGARDMVRDTLKGRSPVINYSILCGTILSILAGFRLANYLLNRKRVDFVNMIFLIIPLFSNLLLSLVTGGRVDFVYSFIYYLVGAVFNIPIKAKLNYRLIALTGIGVLFILWFISAVQTARAIYNKGEIDQVEYYLGQKSPILGALYSPISYMASTFVGYQYRRADAVDLENLGYGIYTFNGFINWTIPFGNLIGIGDISIAKELGIYYHNQETYDYSREHYNTVNSGYIPIVKDFGVKGAFVCVIFLTLLSHGIFVRIQKKHYIPRLYYLFFFFLFLDYWIRMNFYGSLSGSVLISLYPLVLIDIFDVLFSSSSKHLNNKIRRYF